MPFLEDPKRLDLWVKLLAAFSILAAGLSLAAEGDSLRALSLMLAAMAWLLVRRKAKVENYRMSARTIPGPSSWRSQLIAWLAPYAETPVQIISNPGDDEAETFSRKLQSLFVESGWQVDPAKFAGHGAGAVPWKWIAVCHWSGNRHDETEAALRVLRRLGYPVIEVLSNAGPASVVTVKVGQHAL